MAQLILIADIAASVVARRGGHEMAVLQWAHGLRRLGHDVLLLEFAGDSQLDQVSARREFERIAAAAGCTGQAALLDHEGRGLAGLPPAQVARIAARADAVIERAAHYYAATRPLIDEVRPRIMVDVDPGYTQLWAQERGLENIFGAPDFFFTVGLNVGSDRCALPTLDRSWTPLTSPIVIDWWTAPGEPGDRFTTVSGWRGGGYHGVWFDGRWLACKPEEFRKFVGLPALVPSPLELALEIEPDDPDRELLCEQGWRLADPRAVAATADSYRSYVASSAGEFSVCKAAYAGTHSGWFSDRSACYLAAGRPVVTQATGFEDVLPTGHGLFAVRDADQAAQAIRAIVSDYAAHSRGARSIAREYFDSDRVLSQMLGRCGLPSCPPARARRACA